MSYECAAVCVLCLHLYCIEMPVSVCACVGVIAMNSAAQSAA